MASATAAPSRAATGRTSIARSAGMASSGWVQKWRMPVRLKATSVKKPGVALRLTGVALVDMMHSALTVARALLTRRTADLRPAFVVIPLDVRDPNALAVLAMILCLAPGTAWGEVALDRSTLLVHVFDLIDEQEFITLVKTRYERPLMEIFES